MLVLWSITVCNCSVVGWDSIDMFIDCVSIGDILVAYPHLYIHLFAL